MNKLCLALILLSFSTNIFAMSEDELEEDAFIVAVNSSQLCKDISDITDKHIREMRDEFCKKYPNKPVLISMLKTEVLKCKINIAKHNRIFTAFMENIKKALIEIKTMYPQLKNLRANDNNFLHYEYLETFGDKIRLYTKIFDSDHMYSENPEDERIWYFAVTYKDVLYSIEYDMVEKKLGPLCQVRNSNEFTGECIAF